MLADFWHYFLQLLWFFLPAGCANMAASMSRHVNWLNYPVDFGRRFKDGTRWFGDHKTWRGFVFGVVGAIVMAFIEYKLYTPGSRYYLFDYSQINFLLFGFLSALGALLGDLIRSFFKRRVGVAPGKTWFPFDQIDWIIGAVIFISLYIEFDWRAAFTAILLSVIIHPLVNYISFLLKIQKNKF